LRREKLAPVLIPRFPGATPVREADRSAGWLCFFWNGGGRLEWAAAENKEAGLQRKIFADWVEPYGKERDEVAQWEFLHRRDLHSAARRGEIA
jgi:hypothetical protein